MSTPYLVVTLVAAAMAAFSAVASFLNLGFVVASLVEYGVPRSWWPWLGAAKAAGGAGLVVGLFVPVIGVLAAAGLVLYFVGAVATVVRARRYAHIPFPVLYLAPAAGSLALA